MSFLIKDQELLKAYNRIWDRARNSIKKGFDSERVCNTKYLKTKIKPYEGKINLDFVGSKVESSYCVLY